jgi:hypothetical protein
MALFVGVDPGSQGCIVVLRGRKPPATEDVCRLHKHTDHEIADFVRELRIEMRSGTPVFALLEKVHSMPRQGVRSTFAFGKNYGFVTGLLTAFRIPLTLMTPQEWQKKIKQSNKKMKGPELKKFLKGIAQRLYPEGITITNDVADALLIAHVCREHYQE